MRKAFIYINIILLIVSATLVGRYFYNSYNSKKVYQEMSNIYYNTSDNMDSTKASKPQSDKKLLYFKDIN